MPDTLSCHALPKVLCERFYIEMGSRSLQSSFEDSKKERVVAISKNKNIQQNSHQIDIQSQPSKEQDMKKEGSTDNLNSMQDKKRFGCT